MAKEVKTDYSSLPKYYKSCVYNDGANGVADNSDIYYDDEMDYYIVSDYLSHCEASDNDIRFLESLGFRLEDFMEEL